MRTSRTDQGGDALPPNLGFPHEMIRVRSDVPGDADLDEYTDLKDPARFPNCFTGPGPADFNSTCWRIDMDSDDDVDFADFAEFAQAMTGP